MALKLQNEQDMQTIRSLQHLINSNIYERNQLLQRISKLEETYKHIDNTIKNLVHATQNSNELTHNSAKNLARLEEIIRRNEIALDKSEKKLRDATYGFGVGAAAAKICVLSPELAIATAAIGAIGAIYTGKFLYKCPVELNNKLNKEK